MKISTKGRYALRMMVDIAMNGENDNVSIKDVAQRNNISIKYLEQIVNLLSKRGFLKSTRGPQGGYRLSKPPEQYTIGDILRITEGNMAPVSCLEDDENMCERAGKCETLWIWEEFYHVINEFMDSVTLEDIVKKAKEKRKVCGEKQQRER
ncbi:MAG: RrF2 family transcriptional regulator [Oscillospiraceae bacterium]|nr:RrF2 family transcriptional regulator [Oscillospiraceae bacterium]